MTARKWKVTRTGAGLWRAWDGDGYHRGSCFTWADAMQEADRGARTITVVLPRVGRQLQIPVPEDYKDDCPISVSNHGSFIGVAFTAQGLKQDVAIHPDELEPLALALLAHARRQA